jgi:hypothetical protein
MRVMESGEVPFLALSLFLDEVLLTKTTLGGEGDGGREGERGTCFLGMLVCQD